MNIWTSGSYWLSDRDILSILLSIRRPATAWTMRKLCVSRVFAICFVVLSRLQYWPFIWSALSSLLTTIVVAAGVFVCLFNLSCSWIRLNILIFVGFDYRDWDITDCTFTFRFLIIGLNFCFPDPRTHHDGLIWLWEPEVGSVYQMQIFISLFCSNSRKYLTSRAFEFCIAPWFWI